MSNPFSFPFNPDLADHILTTLPDLRSLASFISTSKFIYSIFQCRQSSILGAIAQSQFGSVLPHAMRLIKCASDKHLPTSARELHREADLKKDFTITASEARLLLDHDAVIQRLEAIYSWREKDPRSRSSRLSVDESIRFHLSLYRFWLLAAMFGPRGLANEHNELDNTSRLQLKDSIVAKQMSYLLSLSETELVGVDEAHRFLRDVSRWALVKRTSRLKVPLLGSNDIYLVWSGPAVTIDAFEGNWPPFRTIDSRWHAIWRAMSHAFSETGISIITGRGFLGQGTQSRRHFILDNCLKTFSCTQCLGLPSSAGQLWSPCNWEYMILAIPPSLVGSFLRTEGKRPLEALVSFTKAFESIPYPQFIQEIFDIRSESYSNWKQEDWLCTQCMTKLLSEHVNVWFRRQTGHGCGHSC